MEAAVEHVEHCLPGPVSALTAEAVNRIFIDCLSGSSGLNNPDVLVVEGVVNSFALSKIKVEIYREKIKDLLTQLPLPFSPLDKGGEGGWSFLQMCVDRDDDQWGEHPDMEKLCILGLATGMMRWCAPRNLWEILPGGMPYLVVDTEAEVESTD
jgi:hypothetical protein